MVVDELEALKRRHKETLTEYETLKQKVRTVDAWFEVGEAQSLWWNDQRFCAVIWYEDVQNAIGQNLDGKGNVREIRISWLRRPEISLFCVW